MNHDLVDAREIEAWFAAAPGAVIPESSADISLFAHENQAAWRHVKPERLRGLSKVEAHAHMITMARRNLERFNKFHDPHSGKFAHGGGIGSGPHLGSGGGGVCCGSVAQIASDVYAGRPTIARPAQVAELMDTFRDGPSANLGALNIEGRECCWQNHHPDNIPRAEMPQLPTTVEGLQDFVNALSARGVTATVEEVDPTTLRATQKELDAKKVAKLYGFMKPPGGWQKGGALIVSSDNYVGDGHHRWGGAVAVAAGGDPIKVTAIRVNLPISELLPIMQEHSGQRFGLGQG